MKEESMSLFDKHSLDSRDSRLYVDAVCPPLDIPNTKDDSDYDTDLEIDEETFTEKPHDSNSSLADGGVLTYRSACASLQITPVTRIVERLLGHELNLRYRSLGIQGAKALATALLDNSSVERLDLEDNGIEGEGAMFIADMLRENIFITHVNLSNNNLGSLGAVTIAEMLRVNNFLTHVNLSGNKFSDKDTEVLSLGLACNDRVIDLDLSSNDIGQEGAAHIAQALTVNNSVERLNLSWNKIRRRGAVAILKALTNNYCVTHVDFSWNGFGYEGSLAAGEMLAKNKYLREIDFSNNRINWDGIKHIAKGLRENDTLEVLKMGYNPLSMTGCLDILEAINTPHSVLHHLGLDGISINHRTLYMVETINKHREVLFTITHGMVLDSEDVIGKRHVVRGDPFKLLLQYLQDKGTRVFDLYRILPKDSDNCVSRQAFISGLKKAKAPLSDIEIERVMNKLDRQRTGKISYKSSRSLKKLIPSKICPLDMGRIASPLFSAVTFKTNEVRSNDDLHVAVGTNGGIVGAVKNQILSNRVEDKKRQSDRQKVEEENARILNTSLPPIKDATALVSSHQPRSTTASSVHTLSSMGQLLPKTAGSIAASGKALSLSGKHTKALTKGAQASTSQPGLGKMSIDTPNSLALKRAQSLARLRSPPAPLITKPLNDTYATK